ncbi:MAG: hypothetical protein D6730_13735, partial [Bacteroidetes bacterium]
SWAAGDKVDAEQGAGKTILQYYTASSLAWQALLAQNAEKIGALTHCAGFSVEVIQCLEREKKHIEQALMLLEKQETSRRQAYWAAVSDSIQQVFEQIKTEMGEELTKCLQEGSRIDVQLGQTPCAALMRQKLREKLGRKLCYLNFYLHSEQKEDSLLVRLTHSFPLLKKNENCCKDFTTLSWESGPIPADTASSQCFALPADTLLYALNQQRLQAGLRPATAAGPVAWWVSAHQQNGKLQAYSFRRDAGRATAVPNIELSPQDSSDCGCSTSLHLDGKPLQPGQQVVLAAPGQTHKLSLAGACLGGCPPGPAFISIQQPPLTASHTSGAYALSMPLLSFGGSEMLYNFPKAGRYAVHTSQVCNGQLCGQAYELFVPAPGPAPLVAQQVGPYLETVNAWCMNLFLRQASSEEWVSPRFAQIALSHKGKTTLKLHASCDDHCGQAPLLKWEIISPSGKKMVKETTDDMLTYQFRKEGRYEVRVEQRAGCEPNAHTQGKRIHVFVPK